LMCAKNRVDIFSSFLDIRQNVEWPRFFWPTLYIVIGHFLSFQIILLLCIILISFCCFFK